MCRNAPNASAIQDKSPMNSTPLSARAAFSHYSARPNGNLPLSSLPARLFSDIQAALASHPEFTAAEAGVSVNQALRMLASKGLCGLLEQALPFSNPEAKRSAALAAAIVGGQLDCAKILLRADPPQGDMSWPLRSAAQLGRPECVAVIAASLRVHDCMEALLAAASEGHADIVGILIEREKLPPLGQPSEPWGDADRNRLRTWHTEALQMASLHGHFECARLLAPISNPLAEDSLALRWAATGGHADIVELLLPLSDQAAQSWTALIWAAENSHQSCVDLLLPLFEPSTNAPSLLAVAQFAHESECHLAAAFLRASAEAHDLGSSVPRVSIACHERKDPRL